MKKEELVRSEPELDDVDAEDTALEVDIILLQIRSMEGKLLRSQGKLCRGVYFDIRHCQLVCCLQQILVKKVFLLAL